MGQSLMILQQIAQLPATGGAFLILPLLDVLPYGCGNFLRWTFLCIQGRAQNLADCMKYEPIASIRRVARHRPKHICKKHQMLYHFFAASSNSILSYSMPLRRMGSDYR